MSRDAAVAAACDAVRKNLAQFDSIKLDQKSHRCVADLDQTDDWSATADGISCFPWGGALISLEFDGKGGRLKRIAAYCRNTFDL
jgi:hypothetical protein